jgi:hypothetical protein
MHYFGVPKLLKWFQNNSIHSSLLDPKLCLGVFLALCKSSAFEMMQNLCFGPECSISGYQSCENGFEPNASILLHYTKNDGLDCFQVV